MGVLVRYVGHLCAGLRPDKYHGSLGVTHHPLGHVAQQPALHDGATVGRDHDLVGTDLGRIVDDAMGHGAFPSQTCLADE